MSKNLFEIATKELSQDAFLMWLFENFDDEIIGKATRKLLKRISDLYPDQPIQIDKINKVETIAQYKHMDVIVDLFIDDKKKYSIIIEDKTYSGVHDNQLIRYKNIINKWRDQEYRYCIFYKTQFIEENERKDIKTAGWTIFDIDLVNEIFKEFINSSNDILSDYARFVGNKYLEINLISEKPLEKWNFEEWNTYFFRELCPLISSKYNNLIEAYRWKYQGRYVSLGVYYHKRYKNKNKPLIEFFFREGDKITATIHIETKLGGNDYTWKNVYLLEEFYQEYEKMMKENKMPSFKIIHTKQCVGKMIEPIFKTNRENVTNRIIEIIDEFYVFFRQIIK